MINCPNPLTAQKCGEECPIEDICRQHGYHVSVCTKSDSCCVWSGNAGCQVRKFCENMKIPCPCTYICPDMIRAVGRGGHCYDKCSTNHDCRTIGSKSHKVCCKNECGAHECTEAVPTNLVCPVLFDNHGDNGDGESSSSSSASCRRECTTVDECRNGQICCRTGLCTYKCVYGVEPSLVPVCPSDLSFPSCESMCKSHDECSGNGQLCCTDGCGTRCVNGIYPITP